MEHEAHNEQRSPWQSPVGWAVVGLSVATGLALVAWVLYFTYGFLFLLADMP